MLLPDARQLPDVALEALARGPHNCQPCFAQAEVDSLVGVPRETVSRCWVAFTTGDLDAIAHGRTQGSERTSTRSMPSTSGG